MESKKFVLPVDGFTLIELLAVIIILAIILAIAVPSISGLISNTTRNAFEDDAKMVLRQLDYIKLKDDVFDVTGVTQDNISDYGLSSDNYSELTVGLVDNKPYIVIIGKDKWDGLKVCGTAKDMHVVSADDTETCEDIASDYVASEGVNKPKLATGMTPVIWDGDSWETTTANDPNWYNYTQADKKWANAKTADGSMWVWIPRFIYRISAGWHSQMTWTTAGTIDVQFSMGIDDTLGGTVTLDTGTGATASNNKWTNHPAFTFGSTELTGIWVSKFEMSGTADSLDSLPGVSSLRNSSVGDMFTAARNMEVNSKYGWTVASGLNANGSFTTDTNNVDTHLPKNVEWGAIAYLSKSTYGISTEITTNGDSNYNTGGGEGTAYATNIDQSTTGTIYGIYDISGGATEFTSAYVNTAYVDNYGASIGSANAKYKDVYTVTTDNQGTNYTNSADKKGDAIYETSGVVSGYNWYGDFSGMPTSDFMWFSRGGFRLDGMTAGAFSFFLYNGGGGDVSSFHTILAVGTEL